MNCCVECFHDVQVREMIAANGQCGNCDFCGKMDVAIYPVDQQTDLSDLLSEVFSMYEEDEDGDLLFNRLINDWHIFCRALPNVEALVRAFAHTILGDVASQHNVKVSISKDYAERYGVFSGHSWAEFSTKLKTTNRFHNSYFRPDQFVSFLSYSIVKYRKGTCLYRARLWNEGHGYRISELGAPPPEKRKAGRVNPEGIGVLYLASDEMTALNEVRASIFDFVSVGTFRLLKDISVVNFSRLNEISPVLYSSDLESLAANLQIFNDVAKEISKPLRRSDSPLEYLPTQYITEFIKSKGYSGVEFASTMNTGGNNVAAFDESLFECIAVHDIEIRKLEYTYEDYNVTN